MNEIKTIYFRKSSFLAEFSRAPNLLTKTWLIYDLSIPDSIDKRREHWVKWKTNFLCYSDNRIFHEMIDSTIYVIAETWKYFLKLAALAVHEWPGLRFHPR